MNAAPRSSLARDLLTVLGGRVVAQALMVASQPVLTRVFSPAHLGLITTVTSITMVLRPVSMLRYEVAVTQAKDEGEAGALMGLCLLLGMATTALTAAVAITCRSLLARAFGAPELAAVLPLLPIVVAVQALMSAANQWAAFRRRFGPVARSAVVQTLFQRVMPIPYGIYLGPSGFALFIGLLLGQALGALSAIRPFLGDLRRTITLDRARMKAVAVLHKDFPLHSTGVALLDNLAGGMPVWVLGWFWSQDTVGLYGQAYGLLNLPLGLFIDSVGRTFYPHLARVHHQSEPLAPQMRRMVTVLADLGCFPLGAVLAVGPALFALVLGEKFRASGEMARLMVPMFLPWLVWSPVSVAVNVLGLQRAFLIQAIGLALLRMGTLVAVPAAGGSMGLTVGVCSVVAGVYMAGQLDWLLRTCGLSRREWTRIVGARCLASAVALAPALAAGALGLGLVARFAGLGLGAVAYGAWALRVNPELAAVARRVLRRRAPA